MPLGPDDRVGSRRVGIINNTAESTIGSRSRATGRGDVEERRVVAGHEESGPRRETAHSMGIVRRQGEIGSETETGKSGRSPEAAEAAEAETIAETGHRVVIDMSLDGVVPGDPDLLGGQLLGTAGVSALIEAGHPDGILLDLEAIAGQVIFSVPADTPRVPEAGGVIIVISTRVRIRVVVDDAPAAVSLVGLGSHVIGGDAVSARRLSGGLLIV